MHIFISWSREKARRVAEKLKIFLQDVNQNLLPWVSEADIFAGQRWGVELQRIPVKLARSLHVGSSCGILYGKLSLRKHQRAYIEQE